MGAREQMIDAAERLAAERGMAAMSLREVQAAAGQRNKSAAQYHFGDRRGLIEAVVTTRLAPINEARIARLAALDATGTAPSVRDLVEVLVEPLAEVALRPGSCWARFLVQGWSDPDVADVVRRSFEAQGYRAVHERLVAALGHLPVPLRVRRVERVLALVFTGIAAAELRRASDAPMGPTPSTDRPGDLPPAAEVADLVDTCTAVLEAPPSATTQAHLDNVSGRPRTPSVH